MVSRKTKPSPATAPPGAPPEIKNPIRLALDAGLITVEEVGVWLARSLGDLVHSLVGAAPMTEVEHATLRSKLAARR